MPDNLGKYELPAIRMESIIASPLLGVMSAQLATSRRYAEFLMTVCCDPDGRAKTLDFEVDQPLVDGEGRVTGTEVHQIRLPLLAAIPHPNLGVRSCKISFDLEITTSLQEETKSASCELPKDREAGKQPICEPATFWGRVSHQNAQSRSSDTRAKLSMEIEAERMDPPESLMRVIDFLTETMTRPIKVSRQAGDETSSATPPAGVAEDGSPPKSSEDERSQDESGEGGG